MVRTQILIAALAALLFGPSCQSTRTEAPPFDGGRAFSHLETQVAFGPRVPATNAHVETGDWLVEAFGEYADSVVEQPFTGTFGGFEADMRNILCSFYPDKGDRVLLCAHWDSRHHADRDPDPSNHTRPVDGANDGASGVAVLLEIARMIAADEPPVGVDIVLFDGEDGGDYGDHDTWLLGSRHFAAVMPDSYRPRYAILLDMIGDRDLMLSRDYYSMQAAPVLWSRVESGCSALDIPIDGRTVSILDDHKPLIDRGMQAVDLIDFDYPSWHTVSDTPDKCSPESLEKIGRLVLGILYGVY